MIYLYIFIALIFSAFFSGTEIAFLSSDKLRLEIDRSKGGVRAKILGIFYNIPDRFITTMLLGNNVALVIYGLLIAEVLNPYLEQLHSDVLVLFIQSVVGTIFILFVGEFIPKTIFKSNSNDALDLLSFPLLLVYLLLYPFVYVISLMTKFVLFLFGQKDVAPIAMTLSTLDLEHYLESNQSEASDNELETEVKIIQKAITFPKLQVRDCLIPRNEIVAVDYNSEKSKLEALFIETGFSKIIVYRENIDDVLGYIHSSEMFKGDDWQKRIVAPIFVPESMFASKLMTQLMQKKKSMAVVIDELGGTAGLATLEDIVEEIFGNIEDEHDKQALTSEKIDEETYLFSARLEIDDVNEEYNLNLPEDEDFMTLAGYILNSHQSIPEQGETIRIDNFEFEIVSSTATKIVLVKLRVLSEE